MSKANIQVRLNEAKRNEKNVWKIIYKRSGYSLMRNHNNKKDKKLKVRAKIPSSL